MNVWMYKISNVNGTYITSIFCRTVVLSKTTPPFLKWCMAMVGNLLGSRAPINSYKLEKMTKNLTFSNEKARKELGWEPLDVLENYKIQSN